MIDRGFWLNIADWIKAVWQVVIFPVIKFCFKWTILLVLLNILPRLAYINQMKFCANQPMCGTPPVVVYLNCVIGEMVILVIMYVAVWEGLYKTWMLPKIKRLWLTILNKKLEIKNKRDRVKNILKDY